MAKANFVKPVFEKFAAVQYFDAISRGGIGFVRNFVVFVLLLMLNILSY